MRIIRLYNALYILMFLVIAISGLNCRYIKKDTGYWVSYTDEATDRQGYKNQDGKVVISPGKYSYCFTDTFKIFAIVASPDSGLIAIDRQENILYNVFLFDNGPDYPADGLFRILAHHKIGYADASTGNIVIRPQYDCAYPFEDGVAKVGIGCVTVPDGEHSRWTGGNWFYIDKKGERITDKIQLN